MTPEQVQAARAALRRRIEAANAADADAMTEPQMVALRAELLELLSEAVRLDRLPGKGDDDGQ